MAIAEGCCGCGERATQHQLAVGLLAQRLNLAVRIRIETGAKAAIG